MSTNKNKFEWPSLYKAEERIEREVNETARSYIMNFYSVDDVVDLTEEQADELIEFINDELGESSPFKIALYDIYHEWENENSDEHELMFDKLTELLDE